MNGQAAQQKIGSGLKLKKVGQAPYCGQTDVVRSWAMSVTNLYVKKQFST